MKKNRILAVLLAFCLSSSVLADEVKVRFVSLLPISVTADLAGQNLDLKPLEVTSFCSPRAGTADLKLETGDELLYSSEIGLANSEKYTMVLFGSPDAPRPDDPWIALKESFEGEGSSLKLGYAVQARVLRDQAYIDSSMSYLRVFHGATGTVPLKIVEDSETKATVDYAEESSLIPLSPGRHVVTVQTADGRLPLAERKIDLSKGEIVTLYLTGGEGNKTVTTTLSRFTENRD